jgi:dipeptidyl aminopeptidase/acylaminoacyl peptidase
VTPASLVQQAVGLSYPSVDGDRLYWLESRPSEAGRVVLVSAAIDGSGASEVLPDGFSVRTQVHEYGGRCYDVRDGVLVFSNWADQRLWILRPGADGPEPLTEEPEVARSVRYADPHLDLAGGRVVCVRETHGSEVVNELVAVDLTGSSPTVVASGHDFFAAPRLSPDGRWLAWISWDHPDMPWDSTVLSVAAVVSDAGFSVADVSVVAGGPGESVTQPRWSPDGVLHYISDRSGWWNIYDQAGRCLAPVDQEFAEPDWVFGNRSYDFDPSTGQLIASWHSPAGMHLGVLDRQSPGGRAPEPYRYPFTAWSSVCPVGDSTVVAIAGSPAAAPALVRLHPGDGTFTVLRRSREVDLPAASISVPEPIDFPTGDGTQTAHALFYPPANAEFSCPDARPPLVVMIHGGPTSSAQGVFNLGVQFWTTRGFAVADVDYRGSSGYGRAYRRQLEGSWGVADVEDCRAVVAELDLRGMVDGARAVIRGGSAGGFTTLAALAFTDGFAAGASHYGVADLELLARDTHKFEARYLDSLVGPWPEAAQVYRDRSPFHHVERISSPLILFQGLEDMVVPPEQSQLMYDALCGRGVPVAYLSFAGEQHGFRQAETIVAVMAAELAFYGKVLGFTPDLDPLPELEVANAERL